MNRKRWSIRVKWLLFFGCVLIRLWMDPLPVQADESEEGQQWEEWDLEGMDEVLTESGAEKLLQSQTHSRTAGELLEAVMQGEAAMSWQDWLTAFGNSLWGNIKEYCSLLLQMVGLVMVGQCFSSLHHHFDESSAGEVGFLCVYGIVTLVLMESFHVVCQETQQTVGRIQKLSLYTMPAMAAVAVAAGFPVSGILQGEALNGGMSLILTVIQKIFLTGALWITVLEVVNCTGKKESLRQMVELGRSLIDKGAKLMSLLYLVLMGVLGAVVPAADKMLYRVSGTLLSSVPVVGSALSGAAETVMAGSLLVKNGIGAVGCLVLLLLCLIPVAKLTAFWLLYRCMAAILAPIADERIIRLLTALGRSTALLLGMLVISMVIFISVVGILVVTLQQ